MLRDTKAKWFIGYCCQEIVQMSGSCFSLVESVVKDHWPRINHISSPPVPLVGEGKDLRKAVLFHSMIYVPKKF